MKPIYSILVFFLSSFLLSQPGNILPGQKTAIESLSASAGFSSQDLYNHLLSQYGAPLDDLNRMQGAEVIKGFQSQSIKKPVEKETIKRDLTVATSLETGMQKRFHFLDGTIRKGEILSIENEVIRLKTSSGTFNIPSEQFLEESAEITNKNGEFFIGSVLGETAEEFVIRTQYGDAVVQKRDIQK